MIAKLSSFEESELFVHGQDLKIEYDHCMAI